MTPVLRIGLVLLVGSILYAITFGPSDLSIGEVWGVVANKLGLGPDPELSPLRTATVWQLRLPRVLLAAVAGAGLSLCGVVMQSPVPYTHLTLPTIAKEKTARISGQYNKKTRH